MPVPHYGVWVGRPTRYTTQEDPRSPHIHLYFTDDPSTKEREADINVKSVGKDSRLVFWLSRNLSHPITKNLSELDLGFQFTRSPKLSDDSESWNVHRFGPMRRQESTLEGVDFLRTRDILDIEAGRVLPYDIPGPDNDILDEICPILDDAIEQEATTYIFGSSYGSGIHDIHMNQGSLPRFDNGIYEDGAIFFKFNDGHWEAVFLAFASQKIPTNGAGRPEPGSKSLAVILGQQD